MSYGQYSYNGGFSRPVSMTRSKGVRRVVSNDEIPHLWMHQTQDEARNGKGSFYFDGATIYSYGSHFPIARIFTRPPSEKFVFFTNQRYSVTTSAHISRVRSAIPSDVRILYVNTVPAATDSDEVISDSAHRANVKAYLEEIQESLDHAKSARGRKDDHLRDALNTRNELREYARLFHLAVDIPESDDLTAVANWIEANTEAERQRIAAERAAAEAFRRKQAQKQIRRFKAGDRNVTYISGIAEAYLRIHDAELETSLGVRVPIRDAKRVLRLVLALHAKHTTYDVRKSGIPTGASIRIGVYKLDRVDERGVHAGCHFIEWKEVTRIGKLLMEAAAA